MLGERVWEKGALMKALERFFERAGPRISSGAQEPAPRQRSRRVVLRAGARARAAAPAGVLAGGAGARRGACSTRGVSDAALRKIEELGLGEDALLRVVGMVLDGAVQPESRPASGPVAAALQLLDPARPRTAAELAGLAEALYGSTRA